LGFICNLVLVIWDLTYFILEIKVLLIHIRLCKQHGEYHTRQRHEFNTPKCFKGITLQILGAQDAPAPGDSSRGGGFSGKMPGMRVFFPSARRRLQTKFFNTPLCWTMRGLADGKLRSPPDATVFVCQLHP
jgi:hypothetical protein